jgi:uncharacterized membrane protein YqgA involved in biofilm formation
VTGAILNAVAILIGGIWGIVRPQPLSAQTQGFFKLTLGGLAVFFGLRLVWLSIGGTFWSTCKQLLIAMLAVLIGNLIGKGLRLQKLSNRLGQYARILIEKSRPDGPHRFSNGLNTCAILFCAAPLGIVGAFTDALPTVPGDTGFYFPLAIKALMDGLAMMGFVGMFGPGAVLAALPVFVCFGTITMATNIYLEPFLRTHLLLDSVNAAAGLIIMTVGVVIFEIRRVHLADYLPALVVAPLLTWLWK